MKKRLFTLLVGLTLLLPAAALSGTPGTSAKVTDEYRTESVTGTTPGATKATAKELISQAKKLKADKKYLEAANTLIRASVLTEGSKSRGLRIEAARLYGWSAKHALSEATYKSVLKEEPESKSARLGLAQIYAWTGRYSESLKEYAGVLKAQPENSSALLGRARVKSWMGDYEGAIEGFNSLLDKDPKNNEAREAKARTLWWQGKHTLSIEELERILKTRPDSKEIKRLKRRIEWDAGPTLSVKGSVSSDSDSNELDSLKAIAYINHKRAGKLHIEFTRYDALRKNNSGHATVLTLKDSIRVNNRVKVQPSISFVSSKSGPASNSYKTVGVKAEFRIKKKIRGIASVRRSPYLDTAQLIRNNIRVMSYSGGVLYDVKRTTLSARAGFNDYSDSNTSFTLRGNVARTVLKEPDYTVTAGYIPEYREYSKTTFSGYYNPPRLFSNDLYLNIKGFYYDDRLIYNATITAGLQDSSTKSSEYTGALRIGATYYIKEKLSIEAEAKWSKSALDTSTGFRSETYKAGLNYLF